MEVTIILPVYGRSELLGPALESVLQLNTPSWKLLIADDGSDAQTQGFIQDWINSQNHDSRLRWVRRAKNLGLFGNLNQAIEESTSEWVLLLCSDDLLLPNALRQIQQLRESWPSAGLILSTYESINGDGSHRPADSAWHHDQVSRETSLIAPEQFLPALLQLGSLNGNLTGMAFSRSHWLSSGPFRKDWHHAADWEWLLRASAIKPLVLNRAPIAQVRTHEEQLSNRNRLDGHELQEVAVVVKQLLQHPLLATQPHKQRWAGEIMQHQLWNCVKQLPGQGPVPLLTGLAPIHASAGLRATALALLRSVPQRLRKWLKRSNPNGKPHGG